MDIYTPNNRNLTITTLISPPCITHSRRRLRVAYSVQPDMRTTFNIWMQHIHRTVRKQNGCKP